MQSQDLVDARAAKPRCWNIRALPTSQGFGIRKHPSSCRCRNRARLSLVEVLITIPLSIVSQIELQESGLASGLDALVPKVEAFWPRCHRENIEFPQFHHLQGPIAICGDVCPSIFCSTAPHRAGLIPTATSRLYYFMALLQRRDNQHRDRRIRRDKSCLPRQLALVCRG